MYRTCTLLWAIFETPVVTCPVLIEVYIFGLTLDRRQSKTNVDQKSLETEFSIAIGRPHLRQMAIKNAVSSNFAPRSSIKSVFDCYLSGVILVC